ncbi:hypothetical protein B0J13DRAFT_222855 [Dactylonectria estremocensis]|uniref:Uncharacterized protein n=1 Tax=Dactylonectria estremocensis TaxID=1079267 RepID=A0A9P9F7F0_9HYPO|nr:hypothetical protein B0J13DRAFT_222855 [Dactylonectria estremocensis]
MRRKRPLLNLTGRITTYQLQVLFLFLHGLACADKAWSLRCVVQGANGLYSFGPPSNQSLIMPYCHVDKRVCRAAGAAGAAKRYSIVLRLA